MSVDGGFLLHCFAAAAAAGATIDVAIDLVAVRTIFTGNMISITVAAFIRAITV